MSDSSALFSFYEHYVHGLSVNLLTYKVPLSIGYVGRDVYIHHLEVQQPAIVGPGAKLQVTLLHVKREPPDIYVAGTLQDAWRDVLGKDSFETKFLTLY